MAIIESFLFLTKSYKLVCRKKTVDLITFYKKVAKLLSKYKENKLTKLRILLN